MGGRKDDAAGEQSKSVVVPARKPFARDRRPNQECFHRPPPRPVVLDTHVATGEDGAISRSHP